MSIELSRLGKVRCRLLNRSTGRPVAGVVVSLSVELGEKAKAQIPVSTLSSDGTGYLSFDLQPLVKRGLNAVSALLVSAPQVGLEDHNLLGTLLAPDGDDLAKPRAAFAGLA